MDLEIIILSESDKDKYHMISLICGIFKNTNELIYKKETDSQTQKTNFRLPKGKGGGAVTNWEFGPDMHTLLYTKQITTKDLLYSPGNSTQYSVVTRMGKNLKKIKKKNPAFLCIKIVKRQKAGGDGDDGG